VDAACPVYPPEADIKRAGRHVRKVPNPVIPIGAVTALRSCPKRVEFRFGALALKGGPTAIPRCEPEEPGRLVLRDLQERQLPTVEIGFADLGPRLSKVR